MQALKREVEVFARVGGILRHKGVFPCFQVSLGIGCWASSRGSGGYGERSCLEDDMSVHNCVGEGIKVGASVEVALVGDVPSVVLKDREGSFGYGASLVEVLELG